MDAVYNNLISTYLYPAKDKKSFSRIHGDDALVSHYNDIVKHNKKSPLYIFRLSDNIQEYMLGLKEKSIRSMADIADYREETDRLFSMKGVYSESDDVAASLESEEYDKLPHEFDIDVKSLAGTQVNRGKEFYPGGKGLAPGTYQFKVNVDSRTYTLEYKISQNSSNQKTMNDLCKIINRSGIGLSASTVKESDGRIAMRFESESTGNDGGRLFSFEDIADESRENAQGIVDYYNINNVIRPGTNMNFEIDGKQKTSMTNEIILNKVLRLDIKNETGNPVHIGYYNDGSKAIKRALSILDNYNGIIDIDSNYRKETGEATRLSAEFGYMFGRYKEELAGIGIENDEEGHLILDNEKAIEAFKEGTFQKVLGKDSAFLEEFSNKCKNISINPLDYSRKLMVSYPDFSKEGFGYSYMTSMFSGMLFNYYC